MPHAGQSPTQNRRRIIPTGQGNAAARSVSDRFAELDQPVLGEKTAVLSASVEGLCRQISPAEFVKFTVDLRDDPLPIAIGRLKDALKTPGKIVAAGLQLDLQSKALGQFGLDLFVGHGLGWGTTSSNWQRTKDPGPRHSRGGPTKLEGRRR
jgi:hypothetical protein